MVYTIILLVPCPYSVVYLPENSCKRVIITRLDRLSRSRTTLRKVFTDFQQSESVLVALHENLNLSNAAGKFHVNMLGAMAEMESDRLSECIRRGKEHFRKEK